MSSYRAPLREMAFVQNELAGLAQVATLPGCGDADPATVAAILEEAGKFATDVLEPLNRTGDRSSTRLLEDGSMRTAAGFKDAYWKFVEGGWNGLGKNPEFGGQGLPEIVASAVEEMWHASNMAFDLCPMLTQGAIEAIERNGSDDLKRRYLPNMVSGRWTGTMNLTEPQAGSDLAAVRTRAVPQPDGTCLVTGQKIFITYGEHDYTENIVHLVLARLPDAPEGVKGISLFVVPKFLPDAQGKPGRRNDVRAVSIEHKLGIHASPTCVMAYGEAGGATGWIVGEPNRGLEYMFVMMNLARYSVGLEGVGISERAYQRAVAYARERVQGRPVGSAKGGATGAIIEHPDVRRMLMTMRAQTEAIRAVAYVTGAAMDNAKRHPDAAARARHQAFVDLMIPIVKGHGTEVGQEVASLGIQVHGGMGYIEETGAAQHFRDARITTIYEGTTGIQANDLVGRKTARDGGAVAKTVSAEIGAVAARLAAGPDPDLRTIGAKLAVAVASLDRAIAWIASTYASDPRLALAGSVAYLRLWGVVAGGWQLARAAEIAKARLAAGKGDGDFLRAKVTTARYYAEALLPLAAAHEALATGGGEAALALSADAF